MKLTEDFSLEPLVVEDAPSLHQLMISNAERFSLFLPKTLAQNLTLENSKAYIFRKNDEHTEKSQFTFAIKDRFTITGLIILKNIHKDILQAELAYCIGENYGGKRLTSKGVSEVLEFANNKLGLKNFQIIAHKTNQGSIKVALNNNFTWSKTLVESFTPNGQEPLDMELYELKLN